MNLAFPWTSWHSHWSHRRLRHRCRSYVTSHISRNPYKFLHTCLVKTPEQELCKVSAVELLTRIRHEYCLFFKQTFLFLVIWYLDKDHMLICENSIFWLYAIYPCLQSSTESASAKQRASDINSFSELRRKNILPNIEISPSFRIKTYEWFVYQMLLNNGYHKRRYLKFTLWLR